MARIDTARFNFIGKILEERCPNVDAPVGPKTVARVRNLPGDVMLIQASLFAIATTHQPNWFGLQSRDQVPAPTGRFDSKTEAAIRAYQRKSRGGLLNRDGVIDPASYRNRTVHAGVGSPMMTITQLHFDLLDLIAFAGSSANYLELLPKLVPQLLLWLK